MRLQVRDPTKIRGNLRYYAQNFAQDVIKNLPPTEPTTTTQLQIQTRRIRRTQTQLHWQDHPAVRIQGKYWPVEFEVINVSDILGLNTCVEMQLIKRIEVLTNDTLNQHADTFHGLGCITEVTHDIELDLNCKPVIHPPRKVPVTIQSKVKKELERMECLDVIERVYEPTDWVNSMVTIIKKNGQLRICINPRDLNRAIKREYYPMRTVEEIVA